MEDKGKSKKFKFSDNPAKNTARLVILALMFGAFKVISAERRGIKGNNTIAISIVIYAIVFYCFSFSGIYFLDAL